VEVRIFDTPLNVEMAAALAALVQALAAQLMTVKPGSAAHAQIGDLATYRVYGYNRFQACRFGYEAMLVDPRSKQPFHLGQALGNLLEELMPTAAQLGSVRALIYLQELVAARQNGASWMRAMLAQSGDLNEVMRLQARLFRHSGNTARSGGGQRATGPIEPVLGGPSLHSVPPVVQQLAA
jgi:glutamate---cysteine ligase / carboxylate-amine ligase